MELSDAMGIYRPMPGMFYVYVANADAAFGRAVEAGAEVVAAPADQEYGDRSGSVRDGAGNLWYIAAKLTGSGSL